MEPPLTSQSATVVPYAAVGLAAVTVVGALMRGALDPFVIWVGLFLVVALVARRVLVRLDGQALQRSVEAWIPPRISELEVSALEDWIPAPPHPGRRASDRVRKPESESVVVEETVRRR
jgi:hypothetical protein